MLQVVTGNLLGHHSCNTQSVTSALGSQVLFVKKVHQAEVKDLEKASPIKIYLTIVTYFKFKLEL